MEKEKEEEREQEREKEKGGGVGGNRSKRRKRPFGAISVETSVIDYRSTKTSPFSLSSFSGKSASLSEKLMRERERDEREKRERGERTSSSSSFIFHEVSSPLKKPKMSPANSSFSFSSSFSSFSSSPSNSISSSSSIGSFPSPSSLFSSSSFHTSTSPSTSSFSTYSPNPQSQNSFRPVLPSSSPSFSSPSPSSFSSPPLSSPFFRAPSPPLTLPSLSSSPPSSSPLSSIKELLFDPCCFAGKVRFVSDQSLEDYELVYKDETSFSLALVETFQNPETERGKEREKERGSEDKEEGWEQKFRQSIVSFEMVSSVEPQAPPQTFSEALRYVFQSGLSDFFLLFSDFSISYSSRFTTPNPNTNSTSTSTTTEPPTQPTSPTSPTSPPLPTPPTSSTISLSLFGNAEDFCEMMRELGVTFTQCFDDNGSIEREEEEGEREDGQKEKEKVQLGGKEKKGGKEKSWVVTDRDQIELIHKTLVDAFSFAVLCCSSSLEEPKHGNKVISKLSRVLRSSPVLLTSPRPFLHCNIKRRPIRFSSLRRTSSNPSSDTSSLSNKMYFEIEGPLSMSTVSLLSLSLSIWAKKKGKDFSNLEMDFPVQYGREAGSGKKKTNIFCLSDSGEWVPKVGR